MLEDYLVGTSELLEHYLREMMKNVPFLIEREYLSESPYSVDDIPDDPRKITPEQWKTMRTVDIRAVDKAQLVDTRTIKVNPNLPLMDRWYSYLRQVKNPQCVKGGNFGVKLTFPDEL